MAMELIGTLVKVQPEVSGTGRTGSPWVKQEFVVEYLDGQYSKKACFSVWGADKVADLKRYADGDALKVSFNLESREYNDRWYTEARAWRVELAEGSAPVAPAAERPAQARAAAPAAQPLPPVVSEGGDDDLPF